jgi:hypothetical protein
MQLMMSLQWADGAALKQEMDSRVAALLGPRTADDDKPLEKPKKEPKKVREHGGEKPPRQIIALIRAMFHFFFFLESEKISMFICPDMAMSPAPADGNAVLIEACNCGKHSP